MNTKWYIQLHIIKFNSNYWRGKEEYLYTYNNYNYVLGEHLYGKIVKELLELDQYETILSYCRTSTENSFKCIFEISEEKLFLLNFLYFDKINSYIEKKVLIKDDNIKEGIVEW